MRIQSKKPSLCRQSRTSRFDAIIRLAGRNTKLSVHRAGGPHFKFDGRRIDERHPDPALIELLRTVGRVVHLEYEARAGRDASRHSERIRLYSLSWDEQAVISHCTAVEIPDVVLSSDNHQYVMDDRTIAGLNLDGVDPFIFLKARIDLKILIANFTLGRHGIWLSRNRSDEVWLAW